MSHQQHLLVCTITHLELFLRQVLVAMCTASHCNKQCKPDLRNTYLTPLYELDTVNMLQCIMKVYSNLHTNASFSCVIHVFVTTICSVTNQTRVWQHNILFSCPILLLFGSTVCAPFAHQLVGQFEAVQMNRDLTSVKHNHQQQLRFAHPLLHCSAQMYLPSS